MERTIRVTGRGRVSVKPNIIELNFNAEGLFKDYSEAVRRSAEDTASIREALSKAALNPAGLKTLNFSIDTEYESYQDENSCWKQRFMGYRYRHYMHIRFPNDNEILGKVLYELTQCPVNVDFNINYTVKDKEVVKNALLAKAVADSREKAAVLTEAAGVELGEIVNIDYSWGEMEIYSHSNNRMTFGGAGALMDKCEEASLSMDLEADDISVQDTVTVVWEIK